MAIKYYHFVEFAANNGDLYVFPFVNVPSDKTVDSIINSIELCDVDGAVRVTHRNPVTDQTPEWHGEANVIEADGFGGFHLTHCEKTWKNMGLHS